MSDKAHVLMSQSCRSDKALIDPLAEALKKEEWCILYQLELFSGDYLKSYKRCEDHLKNISFDLVIIIGDRIEQMALCQCAFFHNNIPIIHYGSGITNTIAMFDDINRHSISLMADICLCEDLDSKRKTLFLWQDIGKIPKNIDTSQNTFEKYNIHRVGNLYLDTIDDIDESLVPDEPYDLQLVNPETLGDMDVTYSYYKYKKIIIGCNPDKRASENITGEIVLNYYKNLPRSQFLGLLKNCQYFITNSSSAYYEAPHFLKPEQIIQVGERNKNRSTPREWNQEYKSSDKIVKILRKWWEDKQDA